MSKFTSLHGRQLGIGLRNELRSFGTQVSERCANVNITVGAKIVNDRAISVQAQDSEGKDLAEVTHLEIIMYLNATGTDYAVTGGSTGVVAGANGKILAVVAKKYFHAVTNTAGLLSVTYTDTGTEVVFFGIRFPGSGRTVIAAQGMAP